MESTSENFERLCCCHLMYEGGDMSPRLWSCDVHGKIGFVGPILQIETEAKRRASLEASTTVSRALRDAVWDEAMQLLETKRSDAKSRGEIYYDEDHFNIDLATHFRKHELPLEAPVVGFFEKLSRTVQKVFNV